MCHCKNKNYKWLILCKVKNITEDFCEFCHRKSVFYAKVPTFSKVSPNLALRLGLAAHIFIRNEALGRCYESAIETCAFDTQKTAWVRPLCEASYFAHFSL